MKIISSIIRKRSEPGRLKAHFRKASLSVECAGALSLFFFACVTLMLFMNAVRLQTKENLRLSDKARKLAAAASALENKSGEEAVWIDLPSSVSYSYPFSVFSIKPLRIAVRARVYPWVGIKGSISKGSSDSTGTSDGVIYITDNQSVYHTYADCTHLDLAVIRTTLSDVSSLRNAEGRKYKPCKGFPANYKGEVYVTANGRYYYPSDTYGSLTRHVHVAKASDYPSLTQCTRCAARDAKTSKAA